MRIADTMIATSLVNRIHQTSARLFRAQEQAASGLRFTRPSQDPAGATRAASFRSSIAEIDRFLENCQLASSWLRLTEVAVAEIASGLTEAHNLAIAGNNDGLDQSARLAIAQQVSQIAETIFGAANYYDGSRYLLSGARVLTAPLAWNEAPPPPVSYQGDYGSLETRVGGDVAIAVNVNAATILNLNAVGDPDLEDVFTTLRNLEQALREADHSAIEQAQQALEKHLARVLAVRGDLGARLQRLEFDQRRLTDTRDAATALLGELEGADLAETVVSLQQYQVAYQAAAAACSLVARASVLQYLW